MLTIQVQKVYVVTLVLMDHLYLTELKGMENGTAK